MTDDHQLEYQIHLNHLRMDSLDRASKWYPSLTLGKQIETADLIFNYVAGGTKPEDKDKAREVLNEN